MTANFDNSATTFPKPESVRKAVSTAMVRYGGNPGRGGHSLSAAAGEQVYRVRKTAAEFFGADVENTVFTPNCTYALNMAVKGIMQNGGHVIITCYEHNACSRPVFALAKNGRARFSIANIYEDTDRTIDELSALIMPETKAVCCIIASNVTGRIMPYREIAELCRKRGLCFIADGAQACGILDLKMSDGFNFLCTSGHKALYGPSGTGLLISDGQYKLSTIVEGGTGATSSELDQTPFMPEQLESGSVNTTGIIGLGAGIEFVRRKTPAVIRTHEKSLCELFENGLRNIGGVIVYDESSERVPITAFNLGEEHSDRITTLLNEEGFALRGGLQCAALAHRTLGTTEQGVVRFSPSAFNSREQVRRLLAAIQKIKRKN